MFPRIIINKNQFRHNLKYLLDLCHSRGLSMMAVTKVFSADQELVNILIEEEVDYIADSRIMNLKTMRTDIPKVLLRIPMNSETEEVVKYTDISLNSELDTIKQLNYFAGKHNKKHGVIVMIDLGDLREGIIEENDLMFTLDHVVKMEHIELKGIGTNLTCYGGVIPTEKILSKLVNFKANIEQKYDLKLEIVSGGNSSNMELILDDLIPAGINNVRIGEALVLGRETAYGNYLDNMYRDVFRLEAELVEVKAKPSVPIGQIGMDAFGNVPTFVDKGIRLRGILAIGKQDVNYHDLIPLEAIDLIGSSSDHIIVDLSDSLIRYEVGDTLVFRLTYGSILSLMTSKYVIKYYE